MTGYVMGINPTNVVTAASGGAPEFFPGTQGAVVNSVSGAGVPTGMNVYVYGKAGAGGVTGAGYVVIFTSAWVADMVTTTNAAPGVGSGKIAGVAMGAMAANDFGWFQIYGPCQVRAAAAAAIYTSLGTTATAGALDDTLTSVSAINGLVLTTAAGGAATVAGLATFPRVGNVGAA